MTSSVKALSENSDVEQATGCAHLPAIVDEIGPCLDNRELVDFSRQTPQEQEEFIDEIAKRNVVRTAAEVVQRSEAVRTAIREGRAMVVGAMYDVKTGGIEFLPDQVTQNNLASSDLL